MPKEKNKGVPSLLKQFSLPDFGSLTNEHANTTVTK